MTPVDTNDGFPNSHGEEPHSNNMGHVSTTPSNRNRTFSVTSSSSATSTGRKGVNLGLNLISSGANGGSFKTPRRKLFPNVKSQPIVDPPTPLIDDEILPYSPPEEDGLTAKFRKLASKEREILELNNKVKEMLIRKTELDSQLNQLKSDIQSELINNITEPHLKSPTKVKKLPLKSMGSLENPLESQDSWFNTPLGFIQKFDNMVSQELDKLNLSDDPAHRSINDPIKSIADNSDVLNKVSNKLWSFVNDIKSNLLLDEDKKLITTTPTPTATSPSSPPNLIDLNSPKTLVKNTNVLRLSSANSGGVELKSTNSKIKQDSFSDDDDLWGDDYIDI